MLHFWPSQTLPTPLFGTMKHPNTFSSFILSRPKPFPPHSPFHGSFLAFTDPSHPTLVSHEKHPNPFSCFILNLPKPFPLHSWEPRSTELFFHASFLVFPNHSHPTLGNHEAPKPFFMFRFSPSETLPTGFLGSMGSPNSSSPSQPLPTPLLRKIQSSIRPMNLQTHGKQQTTRNKFANPKVKKYQRVRSCPATVLVLLALQDSLSKRLNLKLFLGWVRAPWVPPFYTKN